jgi:hypothetical protein
MVEKFLESSTYDYSLDVSSSLRLQPFIDGSLKSLPDHKTLVGVPPDLRFPCALLLYPVGSRPMRA